MTIPTKMALGYTRMRLKSARVSDSPMPSMMMARARGRNTSVSTLDCIFLVGV